MRCPRFIAVPILTAALLSCTSTVTAQEPETTVQLVEPNCPYGYYDYAPYYCAPYGYYGPEWFVDGVFIGVGPFFHGHREFRGRVDNRFDPRHGFGGPMPERGDRAFNHFRGNEMRGGFGHLGGVAHRGGFHGGGGHGGGGRR